MKDKVVIITGAGSGIGRATALLLSKKGAKIIVADVNETSGQETVAAIIASGGGAHFIHCDVSNKSSVQELFAQTMALHQQLDCVVNNAGIGGEAEITHNYPDELYEKIVAINQNGVFYCMKEALALLVKQAKGGAIVNISSVAGVGGAPYMSAYAASKHAVIGLTKTAAMEYGKFNIRVNAVCPTIIETPMTQGFREGNPQNVEGMKAFIPLKRFGQPEEVAQTIAWLCSDESSFVTGQELRVDGGMKA